MGGFFSHYLFRSENVEKANEIIKIMEEKDGLAKENPFIKMEKAMEPLKQLIEKTDRETASELMRLNEFVDVLIPRGGKGLIQSVVKNSTVPVIRTGEGNCHIYVDESADSDMALDIIINAKTQRPSVCNAAESLLIHKDAPEEIQSQLKDNIHWIKEAGKNQLVVGSQARILYADAEGRTKIALAMNQAIREGKISAPIVLGRDHHDVSGTDSPYRETSNIYDGSSFTADMAVHNVIGDSFRGATWVSIHNGGGVGWGEVMNGGFGMVIDGSDDADRRIRNMLLWDVNNGIARRSWARNRGAISAIKREMERTPGLVVTIPSIAADSDIEQALNGCI